MALGESRVTLAGRSNGRGGGGKAAGGRACTGTDISLCTARVSWGVGSSVG